MIQSQPFLASFSPRVLDYALGLGGKPDDEARAAGLAFGDRGEDVRVLHQREGGRTGRGLLRLLRAGFGDPPVRNRRGEDGGVGRQSGLDGGEHRPCALDMNDFHAGRIGQLDGPGHQRDGRACIRRGAGDGVTLLAGRAVGEIAHRVDRLVGRARGDEDAPAGQHAARGARCFNQALDRRDDFETVPPCAPCRLRPIPPSRPRSARRS